MSNSIINYKNKYFNTNDSILIMSLCKIKENFHKENAPKWFHDYFSDVIDGIIDDKPIGWCDLELDKYFDSNDKNIFFIHLIGETIFELKNKKEEIIEYDEVNRLFKLEGIERWGIKNYIKIEEVIQCLSNLCLLLDESITYQNSNLNFYNL